jgi:predicted SprT family Zn-dependent metalloprotease
MGDLSPTTWVVVVLVGLGAITGIFYVVRSRKPKEQTAYYFRCPSCKRRLKYYARQVGHKGMCGSCKEQLVFPAPAAIGR